MTYSIVARDPETGALGVAVQTCFFAVGASVTWARAGVGAVATQSFGDPSYGPRGLDALAGGADAADAIRAAQAFDESPEMRQIGCVSASGTSASFTGELCIAEAGDVQGDGYAVQANMMASATVWPAMAQAYETATGPFARRLLAALYAGEGEGGDARGQMSAAMLIVGPDRPDVPGRGVLCDLRVDAADQPLDELARLLDTRDAFAAYSRGTDALFGGEPQRARTELESALVLLPGDENFRFARAGALLFGGDAEEGRAELRALIRQRPSWELVVRSFASKGLLALPSDVSVDDFLS
jgi:uncharacterized Ntn-hydrolase superfamily protein